MVFCVSHHHSNQVYCILYKIRRQMDAIKREQEINFNFLKILSFLSTSIMKNNYTSLIMFSNQQFKWLVFFIAIFFPKMSCVQSEQSRIQASHHSHDSFHCLHVSQSARYNSSKRSSVNTERLSYTNQYHFQQSAG